MRRPLSTASASSGSSAVRVTIPPAQPGTATLTTCGDICLTTTDCAPVSECFVLPSRPLRISAAGVLFFRGGATSWHPVRLLPQVFFRKSFKANALARSSQCRQEQSRCRKYRVEGVGAYAGVSEFKHGWCVCVLVVSSETQPELVTSSKAPGIGHQRNPIAHLFSNRYS